MLDKAERINLLSDIYGPLLSAHQQALLHLSYAEDYSLAEIAEEYSVSRQAVHDTLQRAVTMLENWEAKLGFLEREMRLVALVTDMETQATALQHTLSYQDGAGQVATKKIEALVAEAKGMLLL